MLEDLLSTILTEPLSSAKGMSLPRPAPSKVYGLFRLLTYGKPNENHDGFMREDVGDAWQTIQGSDINLMHDGSVLLGVVIDADDKEDGIDCVGALRRVALKQQGIEPKDLPEAYTASMEVRFDKRKCRYQIGDSVYTYEQARVMGIATGLTEPDDPSKYDVRWITPTEFHACALCYKGLEADHDAEYLAVSATANEGGNTQKTGGAIVNELEKFKAEELPALIAQAKAEGEAEAKAAFDAELTAKLSEKDEANAQALAAKDAELEAKVAEAKAAALDEYKTVEAKATERFNKLNSIYPFAEAERDTAMASVRKMDELAFAVARGDRAEQAMAAATAKATAQSTVPPVTLHAEATGAARVGNPWLAPKE